MGKSQRDKGCLVVGCQNKHKAKGYCDTHYARYKRLGTVELGELKVPEQTVWKSVKGFSKYEVSEDGYVRLKVKTRTRMEGHVLKGHLNQGYRLYKMVNDYDEKVVISAHRLVALAFIGDPPSDVHQVAHGDGNRLNNHYKNLRWATAQENTNDKFKHGTVLSGSENPRALLTEEQVRKIRKEYKGKYGDIQRLANKYGLSHSAMYSVCHGLNWREVE